MQSRLDTTTTTIYLGISKVRDSTLQERYNTKLAASAVAIRLWPSKMEATRQQVKWETPATNGLAVSLLWTLHVNARVRFE